MSWRTLDDLAPRLEGRRVLVRCDLNVPMAEGRVSDATRLESHLATLAELADRRARVVVMAHFGRPGGKAAPACTLEPVARALGDVLGREVAFCAEPPARAGAAVDALPPGGVLVLENLRFDSREEANDAGFADELAALGDLYVNDAFSAAHRAHASTKGLAHRLPAYAGRAMEAELAALDKALGQPERPVAAVVGGAKVSTKLEVLRHLVVRVDHLMIGGGMANTFLAARGVAVGRSLCEHDLADTAREIMAAAERAGCTVHLPYEVVVAERLEPGAAAHAVNVHDVPPGAMILDLGQSAVDALADVLKTCRTCVWNGPLGAFETPPFDRGTLSLARTAAALTAEGHLVSVAGGGDTVAALNAAGVAQDFSFVSTAGGAFLEWMEGRALPGVAALETAAARE